MIVLRAQLPHRLQAVVAVRRPVAFLVPHDDEGIEEAADLLDDGHQALHVRLGRIALIRRRLDGVDRQRDQQDGRAAERVAIAAQHGSAIVFDAGTQLAELTCLAGLAHLARSETDRFRRGFLPSHRFLLFGHPAVSLTH